MKTFYLIFFLFPISGFSQSSYSNPYTPPVKVEVTVKKDPYNYSNAGTNFTNSYNQARQAAAANKAAEAQTELVRIENKRLEQEYAEKLRLQELEKKKIEEERRIQEEKNPNSILNKFKNANVNKENEELKNKLKQMELALAEKEKAESVRLEKEKTESERLEKEKVESERLEKEKAQKNKNVKKIKK